MDISSRLNWTSLVSSILEVRASPLYSFVRKDEAPWNLFLRYHACEPRNGPNIDFGDDREERPNRQRELALRLRPRQLRA